MPGVGLTPDDRSGPRRAPWAVERKERSVSDSYGAAATTSREAENSSSGGLTKQWRLSPDAVGEILSKGNQP
jgi:hypothetical protein